MSSSRYVGAAMWLAGAVFQLWSANRRSRRIAAAAHAPPHTPVSLRELSARHPALTWLALAAILLALSRASLLAASRR